MSEEVEYREDEETGEISFRSVGRFLKKGLLRMLIYVVALCVVVSLVVLPIKFFSNVNPNAVTRVEFVYDGINEGLDPDGGTFDKEAIRSATVVAAAIEKAGLNGLTNKVDSVRNLVTVTSIYSKEYYDLREKANAGDQSAASKLIDYRENATRFDVSVAVNKEIGVDKNAAVKLANSIITVYKTEFANKYYHLNRFSEADFERATESTVDYFTDYVTYTLRLNDIKNTVDELKKENTTAFSGFNTVDNELKMAQAKYNDFETYVIGNKVTKNAATTKRNIAKQQADNLAALTALAEQEKALTEQLANYKPNSTTTSNGTNQTTISTYPVDYFTLQKQLTEVINARSKLGSVIIDGTTTTYKVYNDYTEWATAFNSATNVTDTNILTKADTKLADALTQSKKAVTAANTALEAYYSESLANAVRQTQTAVYVRDTLDVPLLYIYIATVAVGIIAALIVTQVKIKQAEKKNAEKAEKEGEQK